VLLAAWREGDGGFLSHSPTWNTDGSEPAEGRRVRRAVWRALSGPSLAAVFERRAHAVRNRGDSNAARRPAPADDGSVRRRALNGRPLGNSDKDGFTLIELLVAIVLLGLLTTVPAG